MPASTIARLGLTKPYQTLREQATGQTIQPATPDA